MPLNRLMTFGNKHKPTDASEAQPHPESTDAGIEPPNAGTDESAFSGETPANADPAGSFFEKDNRALRIQRPDQASDFWSEYEKSRPNVNVPFLRYAFDTLLQAQDALLALRCIHRAEDTGHLICTEPIVVGCYRSRDGGYEVFLAGEKLDYQTWSEATEKFASHKGQYRNQFRPETYERFKGQRLAEQVLLQKEYYEISLTETVHYQIFEAANFVSAKNFLLRPENVVTRPHHFIHVVTPKGTFVRDMHGIREPGD